MVSLKQRNYNETQAKATPETERPYDVGGRITPRFEMSQIDPSLFQQQAFMPLEGQNFGQPPLPPSSTQTSQMGTIQQQPATPNFATPQPVAGGSNYSAQAQALWARNDQTVEEQLPEQDQGAPSATPVDESGAQAKEPRRSGRTVRPPKRALETIAPVKPRVRQKISKPKEKQAEGSGMASHKDAAVDTNTAVVSEADLNLAGSMVEVSAPKRKQAMRNSGRVDRRTGAYVQYPNPKAMKIVPDQEQSMFPPPPPPQQQQQLHQQQHQQHQHQHQLQQQQQQHHHQLMQSNQAAMQMYHAMSFQQSPFGEGVLPTMPTMGIPQEHVAMQAPPQPQPQPIPHGDSNPPPNVTPVDPSIPDPDHSLVPYDSCVMLRKWGINPNFMLIPPRGQPCPFAEKKSQCKGRTDWNRSSWERHVFGHLPEKLKPYWQCPVCMRTFARKDSFKRHFGLKKEEGGEQAAGGGGGESSGAGKEAAGGDGGKCWVEGNLAGIPESDWAGKWLYEPVVVRFPDTAPKYRKDEPPGADAFLAAHIESNMVHITHEALAHIPPDAMAHLGPEAMAHFSFGQVLS